MADFADTAELNLSQIADAVQRSGFNTDRRLNRESIRSGFSDPEGFRAKYHDFIKEGWNAPQATQQTYMGQEQTQSPYSFFDYTNPGSDYSIQDIGKGQYNILDKSGANLGIGYKSLQDSIKDFQADYSKNWYTEQQNKWATPPTGSTDPYGSGGLSQQPQSQIDWDDPLTAFMAQMSGQTKPEPVDFWSQQPDPEDYLTNLIREIGTDPSKMPSAYTHGPNNGGALSEWEVLGNLLQGRPISRTGGTEWFDNRSFAGDGVTGDSISGLNTLFGSTPILSNGQLAGYKMNLGPASPNDPGYVNPFTVRKTDKSGTTQSDAYLQREFGDIADWKDLVQRISSDPNDYNMFVKAENASKLPGWKNNEGYQYRQQENGLGTLGKLLPLALAFTPLAPLGAAVGGLDSMARTGTGFGALSAGLGASGLFSGLGNAVGMPSITPALGNTIGNAGTNTLFDLVQGKDPTRSLIGGLGSIASGLASNYAGNAANTNMPNTNPTMLSKLAAAGTGLGLNTLFRTARR